MEKYNVIAEFIDRESGENITVGSIISVTAQRRKELLAAGVIPEEPVPVPASAPPAPAEFEQLVRAYEELSADAADLRRNQQLQLERTAQVVEENLALTAVNAELGGQVSTLMTEIAELRVAAAKPAAAAPTTTTDQQGTPSPAAASDTTKGRRSR